MEKPIEFPKINFGSLGIPDYQIDICECYQSIQNMIDSDREKRIYFPPNGFIPLEELISFDTKVIYPFCGKCMKTLGLPRRFYSLPGWHVCYFFDARTGILHRNIPPGSKRVIEEGNEWILGDHNYTHFRIELGENSSIIMQEFDRLEL